MAAESLDLTLTPYLADQELPLTTVYWEGAVKIAGSAAGAPTQPVIQSVRMASQVFFSTG